MDIENNNIAKKDTGTTKTGAMLIRIGRIIASLPLPF
jgi:hypothetical protein